MVFSLISPFLKNPHKISNFPANGKRFSSFYGFLCFEVLAVTLLRLFFQHSFHSWISISHLHVPKMQTFARNSDFFATLFISPYLFFR